MSRQLRNGNDYERGMGRSRGSSGGPTEILAERTEKNDGQGDSLISEYLLTLSRNRWRIGRFALAGLVLGVISTVASLPTYRTRISLEIQGLNSDFMNIRAVATTGDTSGGAEGMNLQTQIKLLQSDSLLQKTTDDLLAAPHPRYVEQDDLISQILRATHLSQRKSLAYDEIVDDAAKRVKIKPLGMTRLVEISCESWNADLSAKLCNTMAQDFQTEDLRTRGMEAAKTSDWLTHQLADVRKRTEESQRKLQEAVGGNGLMLSTESASVSEDRLRQLQSELVKAQADRMQKEALSGVGRSASVDTMPNVLDNPAYVQYQTKLADLRSRVAELVPPLTEANPKVIHLRSQIAEAEAGLNATRGTSTSRQGNELSAAQHREQLLQTAVDMQRGRVSSDLQKAAQVGLVKKDMESDQQLYQTLLQRAKEAGFASAMKASTIRVVDEAKKPKFAASPRRTVSGMFGLVLGSLLGIGFSFYKDRSARVFRRPGDVERYLHVPELGVIPNAEHSFALTNPKSARAASDAKTLASQGTALAISRWEDHSSIVAEAYRSATFSILWSDATKRSRSYVVSSPSDGEGKTTVTSNLGVALSKSRLRVVLVDGDLRKPNLHTAFAMKNDFGLRNILRGEVDLEKSPLSDYCKQTSLSNLAVIVAGYGSEDAVELLHSPHLGALLARLSQDFDIVLIDTPPMLHMADARIFAGQSDGAILVFRADSTSRDHAATVRKLIESDGVRLVGTILNDFDPTREGWSGYYSSYARYQSHEESTETVGAAL